MRSLRQCLGLLALLSGLGCSDGPESTIDLGRLAPAAVACNQSGDLPVTHFRLKGLRAASRALLRPSGDPDAPGRPLRRWRTTRVAGSFDVTVASLTGARDVDLSVFVICGPHGRTHERVRGSRVRVVVRGGALTVRAVEAAPGT